MPSHIWSYLEDKSGRENCHWHENWQIDGRWVTSVRAKWELSDGLKEFTIRIANIKAVEVINLIYDGPEDQMHEETEDFVQPEPTEDLVTPLEWALNPRMRIYEKDEIESQDGLVNVYGWAWKREKVTM